MTSDRTRNARGSRRKTPLRRQRSAAPRRPTDTVALENLLRHAPCGFHSIDSHGMLLAINDTELAWLGYAREEIVGKKTFRELLTRQSQAAFDTEFPRFLERGFVRDLELDVVRRDGRVMTVLVSATAVYDSGRTFVASRSLLTDITRRKEAERERDNYFMLSADLLAVAGANGHFTRVNPAFTATLGWTEHELLTRPYLSFVHPDDRVATLREVERQVVAGRSVLHFVNRYRHKDGSWRWLSWTSMSPPGGLMYASARDVTELRRAEDALRQSEANLSVTLDSIADGVLTTDTSGRITRLNPVAERLTDWSLAEAAGRPVDEVFQLVSEPGGGPVDVPIHAVLATGEVHTLSDHTVLIGRDGRRTPIADSAAPIRGVGGEVTGVVLVFRDVSRERAAEQQTAALLKDLNDIKAALDQHAIVTRTDPQGRITYANRKFTDTFGYEPEELIGQNHRLVNSGYHPRTFFSDLWTTILGGGVWKGEIRNRARDGRIGWFETTIVPFLGADGRPAQFVSIQSDITARRDAEDEVRRFNLDLERLIEARTAELQQALGDLAREKVFSDTVIHSGSGFFYVLDEAGRFVRWNQTAYDVFGLTAEQMRETQALALIDEADRALAAAKLGEAFTRGHAEAELRLLTRDGPRDALLSARRMDVDGTPYLVGTGVDITVRKATEAALVDSQQKILALNADLERRIRERTAELETAREAADAASRAKSAFLANMSHEIRTPLNAIAGVVELLEHTHAAADRARMLRVTQESVQALAGIIDDVLDLSKIEAGALQVSLEPMSLHDVITSVVQLFAGNASAKGLYLRHRIDDRLPIAVRCDSLRLRQILFNLIGNAIKFTPSGGIEIHATLVEASDETARVRIEVSDTGIGISEEAQKRIFEPFVQGEAHTTRKFGGSGLGLAISQRLAGFLGGDLAIQSTLGRGTTVVLTLILALANASELPVPEADGHETPSAVDQPREDRSQYRLLVVDDSGINREVLHRQLVTLGYHADEAADGRQALEMWRNGRYDLLIADCHMPELDGYELARAIRSAEAADPALGHLPILGYTANAGKDSRDLCLAAGMDDALIKPVALRMLAARVGQWVKSTEASHAQSRGAAGGDTSVPGAPVDHRALLEITGGDEQFAREMLERFLTDKAAEFQRLAASVGTADLTTIVRDAHRLKGAASIVAARPLATLCQRIESAATTGNREAAAALGPSVTVEFERLEAHAAWSRV